MNKDDKLILAVLLFFGVYIPMILLFTDFTITLLGFFGGYKVGEYIGSLILENKMSVHLER